MTYSFLDLAYDVLKEAEHPLPYGKIWEAAKNKRLTDKLNSKGATPWSTLGSMLSTEILHNAENSKFVKVGNRPQRYFLKSRQHEIDNKKILPDFDDKPATKAVSYKEKDMHPLLSYFVYHNIDFFGERKIFTKTIKHQTTRGRPLSEWLHPDMVGVYFPFEDMEKNVIHLSKSLSANSVFQIFSFELKRELHKGNYRECFFQAVSNSSWAHGGYLVASKIDEDDEFRGELERLVNAFEIGIVHLNVEDIHASRVLFHPEPNKELDWETINKLCTINGDAASFIDRLNTDFNAGQVHRAEYDKILEDPIKYIRETLKVETVE